ncbi:MAG: hypothetical protein COV66_06785 [Nitrospinae bacterium CG11_big_fil_rev_8_21_14_0_20_45_15]|nr:MAG: hypothetical protein COV66_06785 [Nitrospinae bacterium CG11_big_fil_rev_8_21_14_0_20_45_15]
MLSNFNFIDFFREVAKSTKFQISAAVSFGVALFLIWSEKNDPVKVTLTILFLFAACMLVSSLAEKFGCWILKKIKRNKDWNTLTPEEKEFVSHYILNNTKTRYVITFNGAWRDSGIINPLIHKGVLYLASEISEYRGDSWEIMEQTFPINIHDDAFKFFTKKLEEVNKDS